MTLPQAPVVDPPLATLPKPRGTASPPSLLRLPHIEVERNLVGETVWGARVTAGAIIRWRQPSHAGGWGRAVVIAEGRTQRSARWYTAYLPGTRRVSLDHDLE